MPSAIPNQQLIEHAYGDRLTEFLGVWNIRRGFSFICHVELRDDKLIVFWPSIQELEDTAEFAFHVDALQPVAEAAVRRFSVNSPACVTRLTLELPALRYMLAMELALPQLAKLTVRIFEEALLHDTGERGVEGGAPRLNELTIREDTAIDPEMLEAWLAVTDLRACVAHLGARRVVDIVVEHAADGSDGGEIEEIE